MTATSISDVLQSKPGTVIPAVKAQIKTVCEYIRDKYPQSVGLPERWWSKQNLILSDNGTELVCEVGNHDEVAQDKVGKPIYLLAHVKPNGAKIGVRIDEDNGNRILRVSASGELVWAEPAANLAGGRTVAQPTAADATQSRPVAALPPAPLSTGAASASIPIPSRQPQARVPVPDAPSSFKGDRAGWNPIIEVVAAYEQLYWLCLQQIMQNTVINAGRAEYPMNPAHIIAATDAVFRAVLATRPSLPLKPISPPVT